MRSSAAQLHTCADLKMLTFALRSQPAARLLLVTVDERRIRALHVAQPDPLRGQLIGTYSGRCIADAGAERAAGAARPEERDHVVLIHAIAGDTDTADENAVAIDRDPARADVEAVGGALVGRRQRL